MSTDNLALSLTMNLASDLTILAHAKQHKKNEVKKKKKLFLLLQLKYFVNTSERKLFYHDHISPHLTFVTGMAVVIFYSTNFNLFIEEMQS